MLLAEWVPQKAILMAWPEKFTDWADMLDEVRYCYKSIIQLILEEQQVWLLCNNIEETSNYIGIKSENLHLIEAVYNDTWTRDYGPISLLNHADNLIHLDFGFNGWGKKFNAKADNEINKFLFSTNYLHNLTDLNHFILEGGSIETDGNGTLLTTSHCLLAPNRNQPMTFGEIELLLSNQLNIKHFLWLTQGSLIGDDTDSHIDTLARFCDQSTICYVKTDNKNDDHYNSLVNMESELNTFRKPNGSPYRLIPLPLPQAIYDEENNRLPATYANFLILNNLVLVPTYNDPKDQIALNIIKELFPERRVIGVNCNALIKQNGSLHCVTMQIPKAIDKR